MALRRNCEICMGYSTMRYIDFKEYCASAGFLDCPLTRQEYRTLKGMETFDIYSIACDVNSGYSIGESLAALLRNARESDKDDT